MNITRKWIGTTAALSIMVPVNAHAVVERPPAPEGWLPHFESLIALGVVLMAAFIAICLNHTRPKMRALGTFLAALSCFCIVLWFVDLRYGFAEKIRWERFGMHLEITNRNSLFIMNIT